LMEQLVANDIPYTWGFPNQRAHKFENVALNYNDLLNFDNWVLSKDKILPEVPHAGFRDVRQFDDDFDTLWGDCAKDYDVAIVRTRTYLNWRYLQRPDWEYFPFGFYDDGKLRGYVVLKLYREDDSFRGHIVDILARKDDRATLEQLIAGSVNFFFNREVDEVMVWFWGNPLVEELLEERKFERRPQDRPLILRLNKEHRYMDRVKNKEHWYFCMGDSSEIF